ncbi:helix-turn-helix domain-containing protein [Methylibium petroleiphilum]|uniref:helix-turn-helix domain-containing protein n=1 Tax=Methylibium petroleiphilum TaxID=105560 RepID=UPI001AD5E263|nr:helix-turn-helix transcriptional regulator [Methylibium petroleiphilum]MBN9205192.1 helix-turn-helix transcriptional regulator [Methylibium petroleiphilum]
MSSLTAHFGRVVRQHREQRRWSQELLAHRAEINRSYLGEVERGDAVPSLQTMGKLASAFGVRLSLLLAACDEVPID